MTALSDRIDEIARILSTWPEADRLAGVLRVVRAMGEEHYLPFDCPVCGRHRLLCYGNRVECEKCATLDWDGKELSEMYARPTLAQAREWCVNAAQTAVNNLWMRQVGANDSESYAHVMREIPLPASLLAAIEAEKKATGQEPAMERQLASPPAGGACVTPAPEPSPIVHFQGSATEQMTELPNVRCVNVTQSPAPLSDDECWRRYLLADPDGERKASRSDTGSAWERDAICATRRCILAPTLREAWRVLLADGWDEDCVEEAARAIRGEPEPALPPEPSVESCKALMREAASMLLRLCNELEGAFPGAQERERAMVVKLLEDMAR